MPRQIIAFGGMRPAAPGSHPLIHALLDLTGKSNAAVAIIATATGDSSESLLNHYNRFPPSRCRRSHLALFNRTVVDVDAYLQGQDVIWVGGGNTVNLLAVWRAHGVDRAIRRAYENGVILAGGSAGSLCWFEGGTTDSFDLNRLAPLNDGLGLLQGSHCPHFDGEAQRRPLYHELVGSGTLAPGIAIDDDAAAHYVDEQLREVLSSRAGAGAYLLTRESSGAKETPLPSRMVESVP